MTIVSSGQITITDLSDGNDGVGIQNTDITYANSTSGTTAPSTGWTSSIPSPVKGQYLWTKTVWTSTDTSTKTAYSVSYNSKDGTNGTNGTSGIIVSSVAPTSPKTGQLWQDTSTIPQLVKKWTGSSWVIWELYVENMNVNNLSALSPNLGNITGGSYTSWFTEINQQNGFNMLNGIYLFNGRIRSLVIQSEDTIDKDTVLGSGVSPIVDGTETYGGQIRYFSGAFNLGITPNQLLHDMNTYGYWSKYDIAGATGTSALVSEINGYSDGISISGDVTDYSDWQWLNSNQYAKYKKSFGYVSIYYNCSRTSVGNIFLGDLPADCRPTLGSIMTTAKAFSASSNNNRQLQINGPGGGAGAVSILNAVANQKYTSMYTFKL